MKKVMFALMFLIGVNVRADFWHDLADGVAHATAFAAGGYVAQRIDGVARKLDTISHELSRVSYQVAPYHRLYFSYIHDLIISMCYEWRPFVREYNRYYPISFSDLDYLNDVLDDAIDDLVRMRLCFACDYTRDLQEIEYALRNAYEVMIKRCPGCWHSFTIRHIADNFAHAEDVLHGMH